MLSISGILYVHVHKVLYKVCLIKVKDLAFKRIMHIYRIPRLVLKLMGDTPVSGLCHK